MTFDSTNTTPIDQGVIEKPAKPKRPELSSLLFSRFADMIYKFSGIRFEENKNYFLASKLTNRCQALGLDSFESYWQYLNSPSGNMEYGFMIDEITINETFFYRHQPQMDAFREEILHPMVYLKKSKRQNRLRIWSSAASTGDEIYTIALMIKEAGLDKEIGIDLVGTDICTDAIRKAREGVYRKYAVRNIPQDQLDKYFDIDEDKANFTLSKDIRNMVTFHEINLMDKMRVGSLGHFDIVICRNILIYFDDASKERVVENIFNATNPEGLLILGHSENIYSLRHLFKQDKSRSAAIAYLRQPPGTPKYTV